MTPAPMPADEDERLAALRELLLLDTPPEERFDRLARFAAEQLDTPIALLTLVDGQRQWFKSRINVPVSETPRAISACAHTLLGDGPLVCEDAFQDARFHDNPLVAADRNRFYAGVPLRLASGERLASAFRRARGEDAIEGGAEPGRSVAEWAKLDLSEFTALPEYETIRQAIEKLSREGIRHEFAPMPEGEHLVFMVEDAPAVNEAFKDLEKTTRASAQRAGKELSQMRERIKGEPIAEKAARAREASSRLEAAKGKSREMSRGVETRAK